MSLGLLNVPQQRLPQRLARKPTNYFFLVNTQTTEDKLPRKNDIYYPSYPPAARSNITFNRAPFSSNFPVDFSNYFFFLLLSRSLESWKKRHTWTLQGCVGGTWPKTWMAGDMEGSWDCRVNGWFRMRRGWAFRLRSREREMRVPSLCRKPSLNKSTGSRGLLFSVRIWPLTSCQRRQSKILKKDD